MRLRPSTTDQPAKLKAFQHKKSLGQNFLTSQIVPSWMCDAADIQKADTVIEIGPGTGALTSELLHRSAQVIAVEADVRAIEALRERFSDQLATGQLCIIHQDARTLDLQTINAVGANYKVVANIPYYLTGLLLRQFLQTTTQPTTLVFLLQKEVVTRIARDSKESILSIAIKAFGTPKYVKTVRRGHFHPAPRVDSAILQITDISLNAFVDMSAVEFFFTIVHLGFGQKRKQLLGNLSQKYQRAVLIKMFAQLSIPVTARAEDVGISDWLQLTRQLQTLTSET